MSVVDAVRSLYNTSHHYVLFLQYTTKALIPTALSGFAFADTHTHFEPHQDKDSMPTYNLDSVFDNLNALNLNGQSENFYSPSDQPYQPFKGSAVVSTVPRREPHNELRIHFPALELLPEDADADIVLEPPHGLAFRQQPNDKLYQLASYPPDFVHNLPATSGLGPRTRLQGDALKLYQNIARCGQTAGVTILSALPCTYGDSPTIYLCHHESYFGHQAGYADVEQGKRARGSGEDYCLAEGDFKSLLRSGASWIPLLEDLVLRKSDKACLYVEAVIRVKDNIWIDPDFALWTGYWTTKIPRTPQKIFRERLERLALEVSYPPDGSEQIALPCGHWLEYDKAAVKNADPHELEDACCRMCCAKVFTRADRIELAWKKELVVRQNFDDQQDSWDLLDIERLDDMTLRIDKPTLLRALAEAGASLHPPRSAVPKQLSLVDCEESSTAVEAIREWIHGQYWPIMALGRNLQTRLEKTVKQRLRTTTIPFYSVGVPTPPGWEVFLKKLLRRTVLFLVYRACEEDGDEHDGVHWHDNMTVMCSIGRQRTR